MLSKIKTKYETFFLHISPQSLGIDFGNLDFQGVSMTYHNLFLIPLNGPVNLSQLKEFLARNLSGSLN